ncbi:diphthamide biosynthesis protein 1 [Kwoniella shivajii]|uniref:2-(3-amino-3-carboxypropyl)histidine synthase subunit 1 n=1 Tax=Kwoniella shivajii TaxID=564305 RepID=A0ABZ1D9V5_9TREE|nr:diphthamide biosynthesis protein 1 [Kwoniella shivajii]
MEAVEGIDKPSVPRPTKPRKRFVGSSKASSSSSSSRTPIRRVANLIPDDILNDTQLNAAIAALPGNYNFEIHKTIHHIRRDKVTSVALQMPEGLMMYGCAIADIIETFTGALPMLLADVTYGACCIDDYTAKEMGAEMIVHYGHSCLIPVSQTTLKTLYIFVEIAIDTPHLSLSVRRNFPSDREAFQRLILGATGAEPGAPVPIALEEEDRVAQKNQISSRPSEIGEGVEVKDGNEKITRLALVSTIQFVASIQHLRDDLVKSLPPLEDDSNEKDEIEDGINGTLMKVKKNQIGIWRGKYDITIPQVKPLSPGEVLGCTAPKLGEIDGLIYVGDGRFHLESIMIANPTVPAFRYDPYSKKFTRETYEHTEMRGIRGDAVKEARKGLVEKGSGSWAVLLGTLGRQGSLSVLKSVTSNLPEDSIPPLLLLLSELSPAKLSLLPPEEISTFIQTSCPRLSIDWGYAFSRPLLSPYEASVASGRIKGWGGLSLESKETKGKKDMGEGDYPMDFYADNSLGPWTPRHKVKA